MPSSAIRIDVRIGGLRQGAVDSAPFLQPGCPVYSRANQWMTENHSGTKLQQPFGFDGFRNRLGDSELLRRPPNECRVTDWIGCRHEQQASRVTWKIGQPPREALLDARGQRHRRRQTKAARELRRRQPARQFQQGERVPAGLGNDPLEHVLVQRSRQGGLQQRPCITMPEGQDVKLRQSREQGALLPRGEHERDLLRQQAASHECQRPRGRVVEPMRVIDNSQQRPLLGRLGQQTEHRQSKQEGIRRGPGGESERNAERLVLRRRETVPKVEERGTQLLNRCERELHLPFDSGRPDDPKLARSLDRVLKQRGLADARFAIGHQHAAAPAAHAVQQSIEHLPLTFAADQLPS
ncbi:MAG TPA: hypothetical protein VHW04_18815 [Solirubrobacteraceae bacterium]|nr:hypothetical protein [Solirubrobacteraceae bacterium]